MQSRWNRQCRGMEAQMILVCLDSQKPFHNAGASKAEKEKLGEEAAVVMRGPTKRLVGL